MSIGDGSAQCAEPSPATPFFLGTASGGRSAFAGDLNRLAITQAITANHDHLLAGLDARQDLSVLLVGNPNLDDPLLRLALRRHEDDGLVVLLDDRLFRDQGRGGA